MKTKSKTIHRIPSLLTLILVTALLTTTAYSQTSGYCLMIQHSPADGGTVTPEPGVHRIDLMNQTVTLTAIPKPGYQFACWLGDVSDAVTNETTIVVNAPKLVIAVFERTHFDLPIDTTIEYGVGYGGLRGRPSPVRMGAGISPGETKRPKKYERHVTEEPPETPIPVPDEGTEFPVPEIPEPASGALFGLGTLVMTFLRKKKNNKLINPVNTT